MTFNLLSSYELVGLIVTAATGIITFLRSKDDVKAQNVAMASVVGVALTLVLAMRFDAIPKLQSDLAQADVLRRHPDRLGLLQQAVTSRHLTVTDNGLVALTLQQRFNILQQQFDQMSDGRFSVNGDEMPLFNIRMVESAKKQITATNFVGVSRWWEQAWGDQYEVANEADAERGIDITRIFIFRSGSDIQTAQAIMKREIQHGMHVRYALQSDLPPFTGDVVVIDGVLEGKEQIVPGKGISEAIFSTNSSDVSQVEFTFQNMEANSRAFRP